MSPALQGQSAGKLVQPAFFDGYRAFDICAGDFGHQQRRGGGGWKSWRWLGRFMIPNDDDDLRCVFQPFAPFGRVGLQTHPEGYERLGHQTVMAKSPFDTSFTNGVARQLAEIHDCDRRGQSTEPGPGIDRSRGRQIWRAESQGPKAVGSLGLTRHGLSQGLQRIADLSGEPGELGPIERFRVRQALDIGQSRQIDREPGGGGLISDLHMRRLAVAKPKTVRKRPFKA